MLSETKKVPAFNLIKVLIFFENLLYIVDLRFNLANPDPKCNLELIL